MAKHNQRNIQLVDASVLEVAELIREGFQPPAPPYVRDGLIGHPEAASAVGTAHAPACGWQATWPA